MYRLTIARFQLFKGPSAVMPDAEGACDMSHSRTFLVINNIYSYNNLYSETK